MHSRIMMRSRIKLTSLFACSPTVGIIALLTIGLGASLGLARTAHAQAGLSTGSIQGTILDPNGASVESAKVTITNKGTGAKISPVVTGAGDYNSGPLSPGDYTLHVEA